MIDIQTNFILKTQNGTIVNTNLDGISSQLEIEDQNDNLVSRIKDINKTFEHMKMELEYKKDHLNKLINENLVNMHLVNLIIESFG